MRIVDRKTFLAMPAGTVFAKFPAQPADRSVVHASFDGDLSIKEDTIGEDFVVQDLIPSFDGADDSEAWLGVILAMIDGKESPPVDYDCAARDGLFDLDQFFAVWSPDDLDRLIARLQAARSASRGET